MSRNSESVKKWRRDTKERIVVSMGGKCQICGYEKCHAALELHHLDPSIKDFMLGSIRSTPASWVKIVEELRKCILLCSNCHSEVHAGIAEIPTVFQKFDESFVEYKKRLEESICPVCKKAMPTHNIVCSHECAAKLRGKVDWDSVDLHDLKVKQQMTNVAIGELLGVSDAAVRKRLKKLDLL